MSGVFADTSFFIALVNAADKHHAAAHRLARSRSERLITTAWVLAELGNALRRPDRRGVFVQLLDDLQRDDTALILPADESSFNSGTVLFAQRGDKEWSLTDCISMEVMRRLNLGEVLTADRHFQQAGFRALLLEA